MYSFLAWTSQIFLLVLGLFLMIIVLLQRGRGGGLAGAFGGMGGQSAFGTKAGDVFTKITIVVALLWVITAGGSGYFLRAAAEQTGKQFGEEKPATTATDPELPSKPAVIEVPELPQPPAEAAIGGAGASTNEGAEPASESDAFGDESSTDAQPADAATPAESPESSNETPSQN